MSKNYPPRTPSTFITPLEAGLPFDFVSAHTIFPYGGFPPAIALNGEYFSQIVYYNNQKIFENRYRNQYTGNEENQNIGYKTTLKSGTYIVYYECGIVGASSGKDTMVSNATYTFTVIENKLPLKPWSMTDVINRLFDLCEPLRKGEKPRFRLNGMSADGKIIPEGQPGSGQAAKFDKIAAPQFAFTRQTLRECLQEAGKVIHGEPRLKIKKDDGGYYYEASYDLYSSQEGTNVWFMPYTSKGTEWIINNYQTWIDSNAEHLVNQLDKYGGVIVEPYANGAKSVRCENQYVRITDENMIIATQYPIYTVDKLEYVYTENGTTKSVDITAYVFEKSEYDTRLSSYQSQYPYSKAYGLYFSQGSKNIGGLNFKVDAAAFASFQNYAITNILRQVTGNAKLFNYKPLDKDAQENYPNLAFRITYTPIYDVRVAQSKTNYKDFKYPAALIYNQQSNIIESRYYGENLKGVAARLGNVEKSVTYCFKWLKSVPRAGMVYRDGYYISAVAVEILPTYIRATLGLSKDFNRISAYIGVPSEKRYYEISEQQAVERNVLYREYIVVGDKEEPDSDCLISENMMLCIAATFVGGNNNQSNLITNVQAWGTSYNGNPLPAVQLPVVSSAFGNSISFSWRYENNYSAGAISQKIDESATVSGQEITGYWQNDARYTDYYGRLFYYHFQLLPDGKGYSEKESLILPQGEIPNVMEWQDYILTENINGSRPFIIRKDNREALQINFQIDFVTNSDIIIGSALASNCPAVRGKGDGIRARLYVFPTELNKFTDHLESWEDVDLDSMPYVNVSAYGTTGWNYVGVVVGRFPASGKSWAIITPQSKADTEQVVDEFGNEKSYRKTIGGDLLIGRNIEVTEGEIFPTIYFTKKREIYDRNVWTDIK